MAMTLPNDQLDESPTISQTTTTTTTTSTVMSEGAPVSDKSSTLEICSKDQSCNKSGNGKGKAITSRKNNKHKAKHAVSSAKRTKPLPYVEFPKDHQWISKAFKAIPMNQVRSMDVMFQSGSKGHDHMGNILFRKVIAQYSSEYQSPQANRVTKSQIIGWIVELLTEKYQTRFLQKIAEKRTKHGDGTTASVSSLSLTSTESISFPHMALFREMTMKQARVRVGHALRKTPNATPQPQSTTELPHEILSYLAAFDSRKRQNLNQTLEDLLIHKEKDGKRKEDPPTEALQPSLLPEMDLEPVPPPAASQRKPKAPPQKKARKSSTASSLSNKPKGLDTTSHRHLGVDATVTHLSCWDQAEEEGVCRALVVAQRQLFFRLTAIQDQDAPPVLYPLPNSPLDFDVALARAAHEQQKLFSKDHGYVPLTHTEAGDNNALQDPPAFFWGGHQRMEMPTDSTTF